MSLEKRDSVEGIVKELDDRYGLPNRVPFLYMQVAQNLQGRDREHFLATIERHICEYVYNEKIILKELGLRNVREFVLTEKAPIFKVLLNDFIKSVINMFVWLIKTPTPVPSEVEKNCQSKLLFKVDVLNNLPTVLNTIAGYSYTYLRINMISSCTIPLFMLKSNMELVTAFTDARNKLRDLVNFSGMYFEMNDDYVVFYSDEYSEFGDMCAFLGYINESFLEYKFPVSSEELRDALRILRLR
jgi:hypothetical protein